MMDYRFFSRRQVFGLALGSALELGLGARLARAAAAPAASAASAAPASWPGGRPIKVIVPGAPGGLADNMMRFFLAERLGVELETVIEVENPPGADGVTGMAALAKAAPDGRTLAFADISRLALAFYVDKAPVDPAKDFAPVASVFALPVLLLATSALPRRDAPDFQALLARARQKPGALRWATGGPASLGHLILEQIKAAAGVNIAHVPYPNGGALAADALAGKFEVLAIPAEPAIIRQIRAGRLRPLAVAAPARLKEQLPHVPTLAELGQPSANLSSIFGFFVPAGTPPAIVQKLNQTVDTQSHDAEVRHHIDAEGLVAISGSAADFSRVIAETADYSRAALQAASLIGRA